ncbi:MAG: phosphohistidine phosphatase SixA, partial [Candidatus Brocadiia bacterium]|nr:phosphohistidine phosphatase SixA [Candidatus Brocadiia bacterium]
MRLYLVRHGEARPKEADRERHICDRGAKNVGKVAAFLKGRGLRVDAIWHSGKARAAETARILASALDVKKGVIEHDGLAPNDPVGPVAKGLKKADADLMIVGHLPFMGKLASLLLAADENAGIVEFATGGIVCLVRADEGGWAIEWAVIPEIL